MNTLSAEKKKIIIIIESKINKTMKNMQRCINER